MAKTIGKYEIIRSLGAGAMGEVLLARQTGIGREVAIKTILPNVAKGEDAESRFRREAEAAGKLSHPNIVTVFDFDKDGDLLYLVMEFVKGDDLEDLIKSKALTQSQFLEVLAQVCDGLSHAHRNGIIHRDIKPANVRVIRDGKNLLAKVMDFGIARMEDSNMTATGIVMGTVSYMAPEYIRGGHASSQSDLFAVGVMLYECITGRKPFAGDNTTTILFKIVSETAPPVSVADIKGISPNIRNVLDKALSKEPADRFQTADDFAKGLRACKDPSWMGTLDEATSLISRHQAALLGEAMRAAASPTVVQQIPAAGPTTMVAAMPAEPAPVAIPAQAPVEAPAKGKAGLYAVLAAVGVAAVAGGTWAVTRSKAPAPAPPLVAAVQPAAQPQAGTPPPPVQPAVVPPVVEAPAKSEPARPPAPAKAEPGPAAPKAAPPKAEPPRPEPPKPEPPKPAESPVKAITALMATDPRQACNQARTLAAGAPGNAEVQGLYLAACYNSQNAFDMERGYARATGSGLTVKKMLSASEPFRKVLQKESALAKAKSSSRLLTAEFLDRITADLNQ